MIILLSDNYTTFDNDQACFAGGVGIYGLNCDIVVFITGCFKFSVALLSVHVLLFFQSCLAL